MQQLVNQDLGEIPGIIKISFSPDESNYTCDECRADVIKNEIVNGNMGVVKGLRRPALRRDQIKEGEWSDAVLILFDDASIGMKSKVGDSFEATSPIKKIIGLIIIGSSVWAHPRCPEMRSQTFHTNCSNQSLQNIPDGLSNSTKTLILDYNNISFEGTELQKFVQVNVLSLIGNNIYSLPLTVFSGLVQLKELHLTKNNLRDLHYSLFSELPSLEELYLSMNKLYCLHDRLFSSLSSIRIIDISHNSIGMVNGFNLFGPLRYTLVYLNVSYNQIKLLSMPSKMIFLTHIDASHNMIQNIHSFYSYSLRTANFSHNNVSKHTLTSISQQMKVMDLRHNPISAVGVKPSDYDDSFTTHDLIISDCLVKKINIQLCSVTRRNLDLSNNNITNVYRHRHSSMPLIVQNVNLSNNPKLHLPVYLTKEFENLRILDMSGTSIGLHNLTLLDEIFKLPQIVLFRLIGCSVCELIPHNVLARYYNSSEKVEVICTETLSVADPVGYDSSSSTRLETELFETTIKVYTYACIDASPIPPPLPCPDLCLCRMEQNGPNMDCTDSNIKVLMTLYINYTQITLQYNFIEYLNKTFFSNQVSLEFLNLGHNSIKTLPVDIFHSSILLKSLDLSFNYIIYLPEKVFDNLTSLKYLNLVANTFTHISENAFIHLSNLQILKLGFGKQLNFISSNTLNPLTKIRSLYITNCGLEIIQIETFLNMTVLRELYLDHNELRVIKNGMFYNLHELDVVDLSHNLIEVIDNETFKGTPIRRLHLNNNKLSNIQLNYLENLQRLMLSHNFLKRVNFSATPYLFELYLNNNDLRDLNPKAFSGLDKLLILDLSNNPICNISVDVFTDVLELIYLNLTNTSLRILPADVFSNQKLLMTLALDNNDLESLTVSHFSRLHDMYELSISVLFNANITEDKLLNYKNLTLINFFYNHPSFGTVNLTGHTICQQLEWKHIIKYLFIPLNTLGDVCSY